MIFVVTGFHNQPFDRLVKAMETYASKTQEQVVIQKGPSTLDIHAAIGFAHTDDNKMNEFYKNARIIVGHAGIGTIMEARSRGKPIVIVPRLKKLGEHVDNHQLEIAEALRGSGWTWVVDSIENLPKAIEDAGSYRNPPSIVSSERERLVASIRDVIDEIEKDLKNKKHRES